MPKIDARKNAALPEWKRSVLQNAIDTAEATSRRVAVYPPALQPVSVAQFLLESNWGLADCGGARNYFGIKARAGEPYVERPTWEFINGQNVRTTGRFRKFDTAVDCFCAHAQMFQRTRNGKAIYARALAHANDPIAFAHALTGVYATDPAYGQKLERIMRERGILKTFGFSA